MGIFQYGFNASLSTPNANKMSIIGGKRLQLGSRNDGFGTFGQSTHAERINGAFIRSAERRAPCRATTTQ